MLQIIIKTLNKISMATITENTTGREIIIERLINAPRELVWEAWVDQTHIGNWWGPDGFTTSTEYMEVKPGGKWKYIMHGPDGKDYPNLVTYKEIIKPERLTYSHGSNEESPAEFEVEVRFEEKNGKTNLTLRSVFPTAAAKNIVVKEYGAIEGGKQMISRLEEFLSANIEPFVIERTYNAPIEKVWKAITGKDEMKQWYFDMPAFKPEVGCRFQFTGIDKSGTITYLHLCEVQEVIPMKKISYTWRYEGNEGDSLVTFELSAEGNKTKLKLTHAGLETFPATANNAFAKENFVAGWTHITGKSLKEFVEE